MAKYSFPLVIFCILLSIRCSFAQSTENPTVSKTIDLSVKTVITNKGMNAFQSMECGKLLANCLISLSSNDNIDGYVEITNTSSTAALSVFPRLPSGWEAIKLLPSAPQDILPGASRTFEFNHSNLFVFLPRTAIPIFGTNTNTAFVDVEQLS